MQGRHWYTRCMRLGSGKIKMVILVLGAILFAIALYETNISPSFTMMFMAANFGLCGLGRGIGYIGRWKTGRGIFFQRIEDILVLAGMAFSFPAVYIYAVGDDWLDLWVKLTFLACTALELVSFCLAKRQGKRRGMLRESAQWISFMGACFGLFCGISSPMLIPYGAMLLLLAALRAREKGAAFGVEMPELQSGEDEKVSAVNPIRKWGSRAAVAVLLIILAVFMGNPYRVARVFSVLGKGPDFLYDNSEKEIDGATETFFPGARWLDTDGNVIQAHGGQIQRMPVPDGNGGKKEKYVWIGENKSSGHLGNCFAVYSSEDLHSWTCEGDVLRSVESMEELATDPYFAELYGDYTEEQLGDVLRCINKNTVMERPKMLYNKKTDSYVLWFHSDDSTEKNSYKYDVGMAGVAVSDSPFGPFRFLGRYRLSQCPEGQIDCFPASKGEARDMNLFQDDDGTAYVVYTSENNKTLYISKLNEDYTGLSSEPETAVYQEDFIRLFPGTMREAPVLTKGENGRYYLMSSSTTGWMSNQARVWSADEIFGEWENDGNPCEGKGASVTFDTQSTSIFRTEEGQWIYYGDRWDQTDLADSRYVWLPVEFKNDKLTISWAGKWK